MLRKLGLAVLRMSLMLAVGLALGVFFFEKKLIFYPARNLPSEPRKLHENVYFPALDGTRLHGWFVPFEGSRRVIIISHGNAGNIGHRVDYIEFVHQEFKENVFAYDYRGYGRSEGSPSEEGTYSDLRGAIRLVESRGFRAPEVYLIGQSLGTAVTAGVAAQQAVGGILLEAPFTNIRELARLHAFSIPVGFLFRTRYDSLAQVAKIDTPIVIVHGRRDPVIPFALGERLFSAISAPKRFFPLDADLHEGALMALAVPDLITIREFLFSDKK
jgi:fermentation-respiration switch protein FrsA (DUF1100 family)